VYPRGERLFVTFCLQGALPPARFAPPTKATAGEAFVYMDRYMDAARSGPAYLRRPEIATIVVDSLYKGVELGHYLLHAYVVMPNHVHLLIEPLTHPTRLLKSLKGFTARSANQALGLTGAPFWQKESYDHWVRNDQEFARIVAYIENNPVKAGLVKTPEQFPWSSASHRDESRCGTQ
jgi:type I restriction enzyme R subunit/putative DNA methylase